ncbi:MULTISPECIES: alpha/beta hydrolase [unclassified Streptomyces]|uniref:alpha/beta hydrolase family protein n=1 Tax=unclassified Streptomyces TaxID=2593676 RepID=UPI002E817AF6|nr:alpha/beta hydrolase [Streptomyces sp. NBC_00589]WTI39577.1 alpha/beta hydrolase [Streptomyces sp. NBC_00775]WUB26744.1 alpha/beta hydrolase [Streptomyces sp. NBC_00589]
MRDETRKAHETRTSWRARRGLAGAAALLLAGLAGVAVAPVASAGERARTPALRGELVSVTPVADHDAGQVKAFLAERDMATDVVRYGVRSYRLTYRTVDPYGKPTTATGLLTLPAGGEHRLDLVSDTHGTMVNRDYAPSAEEDFGRIPSYMNASAGRAVAAPDYLGLGKGPGSHPYMDTRSSVTASVDMLRAARTAAGRLGRPLTGDVYATGFSQGGQVAMALGRALQEGADRHFRLRALAPVSGPYDLEGQEIPALFDGRVNDASSVLYISYWLVAQNRLHPIYKDQAEAFRAPYASRVEGLYDGTHVEEDILSALPPTLKELLTPSFYERLRHPGGGLLDAMRAADHTCDWKPEMPVRLYAGAADTDVPIGNASSCARQLAGEGAPVTVVNQGDVDHFGSFQVSAPQVVRWFDAVSR